MAQNVEIKARLRDPAGVRARAEELTDRPPERIAQEDTFYRVDRGRLKLRILGPGRGELIFYERVDAHGPRTSNYWIYRTPDPESLHTVLSTGLGVRGVVRKERHLYLVGPTRIHLDRVEGLGEFLEIEVVLSEGETEAEGRAVARRLMKELGVLEADLIEEAYIDLLEKKGSEGR